MTTGRDAAYETFEKESRHRDDTGHTTYTWTEKSAFNAGWEAAWIEATAAAYAAAAAAMDDGHSYIAGNAIRALTPQAARAYQAKRDAEVRENIVAAANKHLSDVYGISALSHPMDRERINRIAATDKAGE